MAVSYSVENLARLRRAYNVWINSRGADASLFIALMADDVQYVSGGDHPKRPDYFHMHRSRAAMEEYFFGVYRDWEMLSYQTEEFIAQGNSIAMRGQCAFRNRTTGKICESIELNWWHFEQGQVVALFHAFDTAAMIACADMKKSDA